MPREIVITPSAVLVEQIGPKLLIRSERKPSRALGALALAVVLLGLAVGWLFPIVGAISKLIAPAKEGMDARLAMILVLLPFGAIQLMTVAGAIFGVRSWLLLRSNRVFEIDQVQGIVELRHGPCCNRELPLRDVTGVVLRQDSEMAPAAFALIFTLRNARRSLWIQRDGWFQRRGVVFHTTPVDAVGKSVAATLGVPYSRSSDLHGSEVMLW